MKESRAAGIINDSTVFNRVERIDQISAHGTSVCEYFAGHNVEEHPRVIIQRQVLDLEWVSGFILVKSSLAWLHIKILTTPVCFIGMESTDVVEQNDSSNDVNESNLNRVRSEVSSASIYGNGLEPPILGSSYRAPDIPKKYIEPIVLDTSLPYVSMSSSIT